MGQLDKNLIPSGGSDGNVIADDNAAVGSRILNKSSCLRCTTSWRHFSDRILKRYWKARDGSFLYDCQDASYKKAGMYGLREKWRTLMQIVVHGLV